MMKIGKLGLIGWSVIWLHNGLIMTLKYNDNLTAGIFWLFGIAALLMIPGAPLIVISRTRTIVGFSVLAIILIAIDMLVFYCDLWPC